MRNIDPVLSGKLNTQMQTKSNDANPEMRAYIARARNTIMDSSYWVVETIREKAGLGDVSVAPRRQKVTGAPNRIYEIHVDNGIVGTSIREYPDKLKDGFIDQFTLGAGAAVAIAFDGEWHRYRSLWRLVTHEKPWIFWVDDLGKLWTQLWDDVSTKLELSQGVTRCRAMRAWKNLNIANQDQGVLVGYIKTDGKVYYRNYCQALDLTYSWDIERQVTEFTGSANSVNLFMTNDYRMGFIVEDSVGDIYWYITGRDWAGMAIAPEFIKASASGSAELIWIDKLNTYNVEHITASVSGIASHLYVNSDNSFISIENIPIMIYDEDLMEEVEDWGYKLAVTMEHGLTNIDITELYLRDSNNTNFAVTGITQVGYLGGSKKYYTIDTANINNAYGEVTLYFAGSGDTLGEAGQVVEAFSGVFTPTNLVPTFIPLPEVEVIWNE